MQEKIIIHIWLLKWKSFCMPLRVWDCSFKSLEKNNQGTKDEEQVEKYDSKYIIVKKEKYMKVNYQIQV